MSVIRNPEALTRMSRNRADVSAIAGGITGALTTLHGHIEATGSKATKEAMAELETFCVIALRIMNKTNPSKIRSEARSVEILARSVGAEVLEP